MASRTKSRSRSVGRAVRQSVTIPAPLALEVRRVAKERNLTISRALTALAEQGVRAENEKKQALKAAYNRFLREADPSRKNQAGKDLVRAIFGTDALAEDSVL